MDSDIKVSKDQLILDMRELGVSKGQTIMLHASVKNIGYIEGGPEKILEALFEILTPSGTLMMLVGWADNPYNLFSISFQDDISSWSAQKRQELDATCPAFDPQTSRADTKKMGILAEYLRTYPDSVRSRHPLGYVAVGKLAHSMLKDQQWQYREGSGSPLENLCKVGGKVLLLGAPLETVTLLHLSENLANVPNKKTVRYSMPMILNAQRAWKDFEEYDFTNGIVPWPDDYFKTIVEEYIDQGTGIRGNVGKAQCFLFDAKDLNSFGIDWMERNFQ